MQDDIDWLNASSDFGLVQLCREMAALARPVEAIMSLAPPSRRSRRKSPLALTRRSTDMQASAPV